MDEIKKGDTALKKAVAWSIIDQRSKNNISQKELAYKSRLSSVYLSKIENLNPNVSIESIFRLSQSFNIKPKELIIDIEKHYKYICSKNQSKLNQ